MVDLIANTPAKGLTPVRHGAYRLSEATPGPITSLMPRAGQGAALDAALQDALGLSFPAPNRVTQAGAARCVWTGRGQAFLMGETPPATLDDHAALTDQSDAWVSLDLTGPAPETVLARLIPLDLRPQIFGEDHAARSLCQHMSVIVHRVPGGFRLMGFRSMAATLVHETADAMAAVAARGESH